MNVWATVFLCGYYSLEEGVLVDLGFGICVVSPISSTNGVFQSVVVKPVTTKISHIKVDKLLVSWHHRVINLKLAQLLCFGRELHRKKMNCKIGYGILNEIKELGLDSMEHDYVHVKGHKRGHGTSGNIQAGG